MKIDELEQKISRYDIDATTEIYDVLDGLVGSNANSAEVEKAYKEILEVVVRVMK